MEIGAKMATQQEESRKNPIIDPKTRFSSKIPQDFAFLKQVTESSHQTGYFGRNQYISTLILS